MLALVPVRHLNAQLCDVLKLRVKNKSINCSFHPEEGGSIFLRIFNNDVKEHKVSYFRILKP